MVNPSAFTMVNQQTGNLLFKIFHFDDNSFFDHVQRNNYFSLIWITGGSGMVTVDFTKYQFQENTLFAFAPFQPYMFSSVNLIHGFAIYFHSDFFCIHRHHREIELNGVLYNNIYSVPSVSVNETAGQVLQMAFGQIKKEMLSPALASHELIVSYLKIFLITVTRLKTEQQTGLTELSIEKKESSLPQNLRTSIEQHFKIKHAPSDYASLLNISPKALAKITKTHFNRTLSNLINERIVIEAKRELYLTNKTVKEIAYELGYEDEFYFSRFFKVNTTISPQQYRESVGSGKEEQL